jgi:hypothetical protein
MLNIAEFSYRPLLVSLIAGVALFFIFLILKLALNRLIKGERFLKRINSKFPMFERSIWIIYVSFLVLSIVKPNPIWGTLIVGVIIAASWSYFKNYISGTFVILNNRIRTGQVIKLVDFQGEITLLDKTRFVMTLSNGETVTFPYDILHSNPVISGSKSENVLNKLITVEVKKPCNLLMEKQKLFQKLIASPWVIPGSSPSFEINEETAEYYILEVSVELMDKKHLERISTMLSK